MDEKEAKAKTKVLRVKPHIVLPHNVSRAGVKYAFGPDAELPEEYAKALLKTNPQTYEEPKGPANLDLYTFSDTFKTQSVQDVVSTLGDEDKLAVLRFAESLAKGEKPEPPSGPGTTGPSPEAIVAIAEGILANFTKEELEGFAERRKVDVPETVQNKGQLVAYLAEQLAPKGV